MTATATRIAAVSIQIALLHLLIWNPFKIFCLEQKVAATEFGIQLTQPRKVFQKRAKNSICNNNNNNVNGNNNNINGNDNNYDNLCSLKVPCFLIQGQQPIKQNLVELNYLSIVMKSLFP